MIKPTFYVGLASFALELFKILCSKYFIQVIVNSVKINARFNMVLVQIIVAFLCQFIIYKTQVYFTKTARKKHLHMCRNHSNFNFKINIIIISHHLTSQNQDKRDRAANFVDVHNQKFDNGKTTYRMKVFFVEDEFHIGKNLQKNDILLNSRFLLTLRFF